MIKVGDFGLAKVSVSLLISFLIEVIKNVLSLDYERED